MPREISYISMSVTTIITPALKTDDPENNWTIIEKDINLQIKYSI